MLSIDNSAQYPIRARGTIQKENQKENSHYDRIPLILGEIRNKYITTLCNTQFDRYGTIRIFEKP